MSAGASAPHLLHRAAAAVACLVLAISGPAAVAAGPRGCVRAVVQEPFVLPDGSRHAQGLLRICFDRAYSPVSGLHSIVAGDGLVGMFLSRREEAEAHAELGPPRIFFTRDGSRTLSLIGYTVSTRGTTEVYWVKRPRGTAGR